MKRRDVGLIDLTSLLDVVFILLFALILNVNVTRASDVALMEGKDQLIQEQQVEVDKAKETIQGLLEKQSKAEKNNESLETSTKSLQQQLEATREVANSKEALLEAYEKSLSKY